MSIAWLQAVTVGVTTVYHDTHTRGLGLRVSPRGTKTWQVLYRLPGDRTKRRKDLGHFPGVSLKKARLEAARVIVESSEGKPPEVSDPILFAKIAEDYVQLYAKVHKRSWEEDDRILRMDVLPVWGTRLIEDIRKRDVIALLDSLMAESKAKGAKGVQVNRIFAVIRKLFRWAASRAIIEGSPCYGVTPPARENQKDRVLTDTEIRAVWTACDSAPLNVANAIRLLIVTAQRKGEVLGMPWSEIDGDWWTIPGARTKNRLTHRVYLSPLAQGILERCKRADKPSQWVFPSRMKLTKNEPISDPSASVKEIRRITGVDFTIHDLRRTAASHMAGLGTPRLVISKILNHVETGVTAVYERHSYDREKREALEAWALRLTEILNHKK